MAFAPNNTPRLWVAYTSMQRKHEILFRGNEASTESTMLDIASDICEAMRPLMRAADEFTGARFSARLSNISFPSAWVPFAGTGTNDTLPGDPESFYIDWVGRDQTFGAKCHWTLFTGTNDVSKPANNRIPPGVSPKTDAVTAALQQAATSGVASARLATISQGPTVVYTYANVGFNSYWQRKQRTGG